MSNLSRSLSFHRSGSSQSDHGGQDVEVGGVEMMSAGMVGSTVETVEEGEEEPPSEAEVEAEAEPVSAIEPGNMPPKRLTLGVEEENGEGGAHVVGMQENPMIRNNTRGSARGSGTSARGQSTAARPNGYHNGHLTDT